MTTQNTNTQVAVKQERASALTAMAQRFNVEPAKLLSTLKNTVFKNANDDQLMALVIVANEYGLNPFKKEIYAFPDKSGGIVPVVGIDGWINIMNSHPKFDGVEFEMEHAEDGKPLACTATITVKERSRPVKVTEYYDECKRNTDPWNAMPRRMLRNRALAQCVRIAFTAGGIIDEDEAHTLLDPVQQAKPIQGTVTTALGKKGAEKTVASKATKKDLLGAWMTEKQFTWSQVQPVLVEHASDVISDADAIASFDDLTEEQAAAICGARTGIENVIQSGGVK